MKIDFSPTDIEKIRQLNADGKSMQAIGVEFHCSIGRIQRAYRELGLKPLIQKYDFTANEIETIKQLLAKKVPRKQIAAAVGLNSQMPITRLLTNLGIETPNRKWSDKECNDLRKLHAAGKTQTEIADALGHGQSAVSRMYQKLGLKGIETAISPLQTEAIIAMHTDEVEVKDIAIRLDLGETTIRRALDKAGIEISRLLTDQEKLQIIALRNSGMYIRDIAIETERSTNTVLDHLHSVGITGNLDPGPEPENKICNVCNDKNPIDEFRQIKQIRKDGSVLYTRHAHCDRCRLLRATISQSINAQLKKSLANKDGASCLDHLPFSIIELKQHLEGLFEPWMTWENWGHYNKDDWSDEDQSTWIWHIDHIKPHAAFKYTSMEDQLFKECWALSNLRPYSAKDNVRDNDRGLRLSK